MASETGIPWTGATWSPITGCDLESPGCTHCYAMKLAGTRLRHHPSRIGLTRETAGGPVWTGEVRLNVEWLDLPRRWRRPRMIFVCAHSDLFNHAVPDAWIDEVFGVMWACLQDGRGGNGHVFQVLTKRAWRMRDYLAEDRREQWAQAARRWARPCDAERVYQKVLHYEGSHPRIWLGVSAEDQKRADQRIADLLESPAAVHWVSIEPMLGEIDLERVRDAEGRTFNALSRAPGVGHPSGERLDWVVVGCESGDRARPMDVAWVRRLQGASGANGADFYMKQLPRGRGSRVPLRELAEFPEDLRVRDYPAGQHLVGILRGHR